MTNKQKFKPGDKVRCLESSGGGYSRGTIYTVKEVCEWGTLYTEIDDNGHTSNGWAGKHFELVTGGKLMKFKPGDRVVALASSSCKGFCEGRQYSVKGYGVGAQVLVECDDKGSAYNGWDEQFFEFVSQESELEALVRKANEGEQAIQEIFRRYPKQVQFESRLNGIGGLLDESWGAATFSIVKKTKKFKVAQWDAEISGNDVKIGCATFNKGQLKCSLIRLTREGFTSSNDFVAYRGGIKYMANEITWGQAEALLKELEK